MNISLTSTFWVKRHHHWHHHRRNWALFPEEPPRGYTSIEVKYIGYLTLHKEITVQKNSTQEVNFELEADNIALDEVVVSANRTATMRWKPPVLLT